jgi:hypothetical protein
MSSDGVRWRPARPRDDAVLRVTRCRRFSHTEREILAVGLTFDAAMDGCQTKAPWYAMHVVSLARGSHVLLFFSR